MALVLVRAQHKKKWCTNLQLLVHEPIQPAVNYWLFSLPLTTPFNIGMLTTDEWGCDARERPKDKHLTDKIFTQRIERNNLTLRTRIKRLASRTICISRSVELHEKASGAFIEKYIFY